MSEKSQNQSSQSQNDEKLMAHQFDGIQEYDNPIPLWMSIIFVGTILFSLVYVLYYHGLEMGELPRQAYEAELAEYEKLKSEIEASKPKVDLAALVNNAEVVAKGQDVYTTTCASCHGDKAQGLVGPRLTDDIWNSGDGSIESIAMVIREGVVEKGMPPWKSLGDEAVNSVAAFVFGLSHGDNPYGQAATVASNEVESSTAPDGEDSNQASQSAQTFAAMCVACHGSDGKGEGLPGVDLTDDEWISGSGTVESIRDVIWKGVPAKGMPPWASLGEETVSALAPYVHDLGAE